MTSSDRVPRQPVDYELPCPCGCSCDSMGACLDLDDASWPDPAHPENGWDDEPATRPSSTAPSTRGNADEVQP